MDKHEIRAVYGIICLITVAFLFYAIGELLANKEHLLGFVVAIALVTTVYFSGWLVEVIINKLKKKGEK